MSADKQNEAKATELELSIADVLEAWGDDHEYIEDRETLARQLAARARALLAAQPGPVDRDGLETFLRGKFAYPRNLAWDEVADAAIAYLGAHPGPVACEPLPSQCWFCKKPREQLDHLVAKDGIGICGGCVAIAETCIEDAEAENQEAQPASNAPPSDATTEKLRASLAGYEQSTKRVIEERGEARARLDRDRPAMVQTSAPAKTATPALGFETQRKLSNLEHDVVMYRQENARVHQRICDVAKENKKLRAELEAAKAVQPAGMPKVGERVEVLDNDAGWVLSEPLTQRPGEELWCLYYVDGSGREGVLCDFDWRRVQPSPQEGTPLVVNP